MTAATKKHCLIDHEWPEFGWAARPPGVDCSELEQRLESLRDAMASARLTHVVIYADREHFASMAWLTNFDPRFEEAILIVATSGKPLVVVGNECEAYLGISPLYTAASFARSASSRCRC